MSYQSSPIGNVIRKAIPRSVRNWLRSPSRSAEWLWDAAFFSLGRTERLKLAPELLLICHPHFYKVVRQAQIDDPHQAEEFRSFISFCSKDMFLFDIGAHFGVFSLAVANFGGRAVAADPSPTATRMIHVEAALNHCQERIHIIEAAISDISGEMGLLSSGAFSDGYFKVANGRLPTELTKTPAVTVDQLTETYGLPTHLKVDVEGHEAAVLRGAKHTIQSGRPLLFLELHNEMVRADGGDPHTALDLLDESNYSTFALSGSPIGRSEILAWPIIRLVAKPNSSRRESIV
jgi:FkbM family methyltransferase